MSLFFYVNFIVFISLDTIPVQVLARVSFSLPRISPETLYAGANQTSHVNVIIFLHVTAKPLDTFIFAYNLLYYNYLFMLVSLTPGSVSADICISRF